VEVNETYSLPLCWECL